MALVLNSLQDKKILLKIENICTGVPRRRQSKPLYCLDWILQSACEAICKPGLIVEAAYRGRMSKFAVSREL